MPVNGCHINCIVVPKDMHRGRFWHATHDCVAPYVDIILHRGRFWAKSAASGSVRWWCFRACWMELSHVMRGRPSCLLQSAGGEAIQASKCSTSTAISSTYPLGPTSPYLRPFVICSVAFTNNSFPRADIENPSTYNTNSQWSQPTEEFYKHQAHTD